MQLTEERFYSGLSFPGQTVYRGGDGIYTAENMEAIVAGARAIYSHCSHFQEAESE